jgi:hypothetical protein
MSESTKNTQPPRYEPISECIYCGATDELTDEHIIPLALMGTLLLPDASCKACAALTSAIERKVLRGFMYKARVVGDFPSRRKKLRPKTLATRLIAHDNRVVEKQLPLDEAAALLTLPMLSRASVLSNQMPAHGVKIVGLETVPFGKNIEALVRDQNALGIEIPTQLQATAFVQLLAKIAYGYLVATQGLFPRDQTPLLRLIRGEADDGSSWVGSGEYRLKIEANGQTHAMGGYFVRNAEMVESVIVRIKLFSNFGTTGYEVATRMPGWQQYAAMQPHAQ